MAELGLGADNWSILYSKAMPGKPTNEDFNGKKAWYIDLKGDAEPHYITRNAGDSVRAAIKDNDSSFVVTMKIDGTPDTATYKAVGNPGGGTPAITVMMRRGTDLTVANNRMWCKTNRLTIREGQFTITCPIKRADWSNVDGQTPSSGAWSDMLAKMNTLGVTFGGTFFGHGVKMDSGESRIWMLEWQAV